MGDWQKSAGHFHRVSHRRWQEDELIVWLIAYRTSLWMFMATANTQGGSWGLELCDSGRAEPAGVQVPRHQFLVQKFSKVAKRIKKSSPKNAISHVWNSARHQRST